MNKKTLAFICKICPFCITGRAFPESKFAKKLAEVEKDCPACNAYKELYGEKK